MRSLGILVITFSIMMLVLLQVSADELDDITGCCIDTDEGLCTPFSEKISCEEDINGEWYADEFCNIDGEVCKEGCCELGIINMWVTRRTCEKQSELFGIASTFKEDVPSEEDCLVLSEDKDIGACIYEISGENICTFTSRLECDAIDGRFNVNKLCSNEELNSSCIRQDHIECLEGKDEIYWYDSCGNPENIYSSDRDTSWNNGMVLSKEQSCNPESDNSNSNSCGNCDYEKGSFCAEMSTGYTSMKDGDFTCRNLNCNDAPDRVGPRGRVLTKKDRIAGESWCVYDGPIGAFGLGEIGLFSQDLVGSRHYRYVCSNGEVEVDPCQDYRKEICVEKTKDGKSEAMCRVNMWEQCIDTNSENGCEGVCLATCVAKPDCRIQAVLVGENFKFTLCVPKYPPGFDSDILSGIVGMGMSEISMKVGKEQDALGQVDSLVSDFINESTDSEIAAKDVCSIASMTCTSTWVEQCSGAWRCKDNCDCHSESFVMQMNNLCISLGDCGVYSNLMGGITPTGAYVRKDGYLGRVPLQPAILGIAYLGMQLVPSITPADGGIFDDLSDILKLGSDIAGIAEPFIGGMGGGYNIIENNHNEWTRTEGNQDLAYIFAPLGWISEFCDSVRTVDVVYNCGVATVAVPGNLCSSCDGGELKPCSRYKCESLNPFCRLINEDTGEDKCVMERELDNLPIISPDESALNKSIFSYTDIEDEGFSIRDANGECIESFLPINFGIKTSAYSQCRFESTSESFYNMTGILGDEEVFLRNHSLVLSLPSVESVIFAAIGEGADERTYQEAYDELYNQAEPLTADMDLYIKCINPAGEETPSDYKINFCMKPGPDTDAPKIKSIVPLKDSILRFDATRQDIRVYVDEPADCKWGTTHPNLGTQLENYNLLPNGMACSATGRDVSIGYYPCNTTLVIENETSEFVIICRDQPWLGENESRNLGETYNYSLKTSNSKLEIDSITPNGELIYGSSPATINLEVKTSGGANSGEAFCKYSIDIGGIQNKIYVRFASTGDSSIHQSPGLQFLTGSNKIKVKCEDRSGNTAEKEVNMNLKLDTRAPLLTRAFREGSGLNILTDEEAECYYDTRTCNFDIESGVSMTTALSSGHSVEWNSDITYHIKCQDVWGNHDSGCSIIVRPSDI